MTWRSRVYGVSRAVLPERLQNRVGGSRLLRPVRDLVIRTGGSDRIATAVVDFEYLRFHFSGNFSSVEHAKRGIESRICRLAMDNLASGGSGFDVGANYGFVALVMALSVAPGNTVAAYEPEAQIATVTRRNLIDNNLESVCQLTEVFVGDGTNHTVTIDDEASRLGLKHVAFIKIDVDGPDFDVLRGSEAVVERDHPVIVVEMSRNESEIFDWLAERFEYLVDLDGHTVERGRWPGNIVASSSPIAIPARGSLTP